LGINQISHFEGERLAPILLHTKLDFDGLRPASGDIESAEILEFFGFSGTRAGQGHSGS